MQTLETKTLTWHHFLKPVSSELRWLETNFALHPVVLEELTQPTLRPKVDSYDGYLYLVLHFPVFEPETRKSHPAEVDLILTKKTLITASYEPIPPLDDFLKKCAADKSCEELYLSRTPAHLAFFVIKSLYDFALRELDHIHKNINLIEGLVFQAGEEERFVEELALIRHDIIDFRRAVKPQQHVLESLAGQGTRFFGSALKPFFDELVGEHLKVWNLLENSKEAVEALYNNSVAALTVKENRAIRILSILAFFTFPLMLVATIFSMRTVKMPLVDNPNGFWIIIAAMVVLAAAMFMFFKKQKWL